MTMSPAAIPRPCVSHRQAAVASPIEAPLGGRPFAAAKAAVVDDQYIEPERVKDGNRVTPMRNIAGVAVKEQQRVRRLGAAPCRRDQPAVQCDAVFRRQLDMLKGHAPVSRCRLHRLERIKDHARLQPPDQDAGEQQPQQDMAKERREFDQHTWFRKDRSAGRIPMEQSTVFREQSAAPVQQGIGIGLLDLFKNRVGDRAAPVARANASSARSAPAQPLASGGARHARAVRKRGRRQGLLQPRRNRTGSRRGSRCRSFSSNSPTATEADLDAPRVPPRRRGRYVNAFGMVTVLQGALGRQVPVPNPRAGARAAGPRCRRAEPLAQLPRIPLPGAI